MSATSTILYSLFNNHLDDHNRKVQGSNPFPLPSLRRTEFNDPQGDR
jgi:hypothetical protein